jgi:hypothetical protein
VNFGGASPQALPRLGSLVLSDDPTQLPYGVASVVRNNRYIENSIDVRYGFRPVLKFGNQGSDLQGFCALRYLGLDNAGDEQMVLGAYTANDGHIYSASPMDQASVTKLTTDAFLSNANYPLYPNLRPQMRQAYNRVAIAMGSLEMGAAPPLIIAQQDGATHLDPLSDKPVGVPWTAGTRYRVGHCVTPTTPNGIIYRCTVAGISDTAEPTWPTTLDATVGDGSVTWQENTPTVGAGLPPTAPPVAGSPVSDPGSSIVDGAVVYAACTWVNSFGEGNAAVVDKLGNFTAMDFTNTTGGPVDLPITLPTIPADLAALDPQYRPTAVNLYIYISTTGADPVNRLDLTYYGFVQQGNPGDVVTLTVFPSGAAPPTVNTAYITDAGNVSSGTRYMIWLFRNRNGYITGVSNPVPVLCSTTAEGRKIAVSRVPIGPYNTTERICAFTVAGQSSAGPYFYIDVDDYVDPGLGESKILQTSTRIKDNTTTTAVFDFLDTYLPLCSEVTDYFDRIEVPPCSDVNFSKTLNRVIYCGAWGFPSTALISDIRDPEGVRVPGGNCDVSPNDGDRLVCVRELKDIQVAYKENSAHSISPNNADPREWPVNELWRGCGPVGPRAIDVGVIDQTAFHVFAHRTGLYVFTSGTPTPIVKEIAPIWEGINWDCGPQIAVSIDPLRREVRVHVPFGDSTVNNLTITVNYYFGWDDPVIFAARTGRLIPDPHGRKYSLDDLEANFSMYLDRRYLLGDAPVSGVAAYKECLLLAGPDGALYTMDETQGAFDYAYDGTTKKGIPWVWRSVPGTNPKLSIMSLLGASISGKGAGKINLRAFDDEGQNIILSTETRPCALGVKETKLDFGTRAVHSERFGVQIDNLDANGEGIIGARGEIHQVILWIKPYLSGRGA